MNEPPRECVLRLSGEIFVDACFEYGQFFVRNNDHVRVNNKQYFLEGLKSSNCIKFKDNNDEIMVTKTSITITKFNSNESVTYQFGGSMNEKLSDSSGNVTVKHLNGQVTEG